MSLYSAIIEEVTGHGPTMTTLATGPMSAEERMRALYHAHAKPVYWFLLRLTLGDRQAAEDVLQETMLRAWQKIDALDVDVNKLRPWLMTVARRIVIDGGRARRIRPSEVFAIDMTAMPDRDDTIEHLLASETIQRALLSHSPQHRIVITEMYLRSRSAGEVARLLGIPEGTVKSRAYYALRALRTALGRS